MPSVYRYANVFLNCLHKDKIDNLQFYSWVSCKRLRM